MFTSCTSLTTFGDLSKWDTSQVTTMQYLFRGNPQINGSEIKWLENWDVSSCTNFSDITNSIGYNYPVIDGTFSYNNWKLSTKPTSFSRLCHYGPNYKILDFSKLDFSKITSMSEMFVGQRCSTVKFGKNITETVGIGNIFVYAYGITDLYFDEENTTTAWQRIADATMRSSNVTVHIGSKNYKKINNVWTEI